jgi:aldose 1-epimerase
MRTGIVAVWLAVVAGLSCGCTSSAIKKEIALKDVSKLSVMKTNFGKADGKDVYLFTLTNRHGITVKITNYGGIITSILMPAADGSTGNIVLGYDSLSGYLAKTPYFGAIVGRYANRIANAEFTLDGQTYHLSKNDGPNTLHGGLKGFDKVVWDAQEFSDSANAGLHLTYLSRDGEEGYPGNLQAGVTYILNNEDELHVVIEAVTDKASPVNLCNHTYFNLNGAESDILSHELMIPADRYTEVNDVLIPTGKLPLVKDGPMDFNEPTAIGKRIAQVNGGYDHNYVLRRKDGGVSLAAVLFDPSSGREVTVETTQLGLQFYSGNFLDGSITGSGGKVYQKHYGLCLETQHFPDSPNQKDFPNAILRPGSSYLEKTVFRFAVLER